MTNKIKNILSIIIAVIIITAIVVTVVRYFPQGGGEVTPQDTVLVQTEVDSAAIGREWYKTHIVPTFAEEKKDDSTFTYTATAQAEIDGGMVELDIVFASPTPIDPASYFDVGLQYKELHITRTTETTIIKPEDKDFWDRFGATAEVSYKQRFMQQLRTFNGSVEGSFAFNHFEIFVKMGAELGYTTNDVYGEIGVRIDL